MTYFFMIGTEWVITDALECVATMAQAKCMALAISHVTEKHVEIVPCTDGRFTRDHAFLGSAYPAYYVGGYEPEHFGHGCRYMVVEEVLDLYGKLKEAIAA